MSSSRIDRPDAQSAGETGVILRLGDPDRHFWLVRSVARVMGLNLGEAIVHGVLQQESYRCMVNRCRTCPLVTSCQGWLASSAGQAEAPPPGCLIAAQLNHLKHMTSNEGAH